MEAKHTPGPWTEVRPIASLYGSFGVKEIHEDIKATYESGQPWQEKQEANARLIAAAPELLDVARLALEAMGQAFDETFHEIPEGSVVPPWLVDLERATVAARVAIARATA